MPYKLMGFGAAFIASLFAWHFTREPPAAALDGRLSSAQDRFDAGEPAGEAEPIAPVAQPNPAQPHPAQPTPAQPRAPGPTEPELDITVVVPEEQGTVAVEETVLIDNVPVPEPQRVVIIVQQSAPADPPPTTRRVRGAPYGGRMPSGGFTPRNPGVPSGPLVPRTNRSTPRRSAARPPRRRASSGGRMGGMSVPRRRPGIRRR